MTKGIIVLEEIPNNCFHCRLKKRPVGMSFPEDMVCGVAEQSVCQYKPHNINGKKPDWCPIKEMPEKKMCSRSICIAAEEYYKRKGWNACIDEILKGDFLNDRK